MVIVEGEPDRDARLYDAGLTLLVDKFLEVRASDEGEVTNPQHETDRVQDVGLAGPVQPGDRSELGVERADFCPHSIGFETIDDDLLDVHGPVQIATTGAQTLSLAARPLELQQIWLRLVRIVAVASQIHCSLRESITLSEKARFSLEKNTASFFPGQRNGFVVFLTC